MCANFFSSFPIPSLSPSFLPHPLPFHKAAMTNDQVQRTEETVLEIIRDNKPILVQESPLTIAKSVQGLRTVSDEVCISFLIHVALAVCA